MHWWEHTVEIFCQNFLLSRWSERLQTICVRVALQLLQLLQLLHLQDFCLSATQWDKTFPDNSYSSGNMHVQFFLVNISTRQWLPPNIFPSHSEWWDWPGRSRCKNAKAQRNCGENNSLGLAFRNICSCQLRKSLVTQKVRPDQLGTFCQSVNKKLKWANFTTIYLFLIPTKTTSL